MTDASATLRPLTTDECIAYLAKHHFGRLAVVVDGRPTIIPVNYIWDDDAVAVRTDAGSGALASAMSWVAFEIDQVDADAHEGWTVVVQGFAHDITDAIDGPSVAARALPLTPWAPGEKRQWLRITEATITGRRLSR